MLCCPNESSRQGDIEARGENRVNCGPEIAKELGTERVVLLCCHKVGEGILSWQGDVGKVQGKTEGVEERGEVRSPRQGVSQNVVLALDVNDEGKVILCQHFLPLSQSR